MSFWLGTAFPAEWAAGWVSYHSLTVWTLTIFYVLCSSLGLGYLPVVKHGLLPSWYRLNGIFQLCLLIGFMPEMAMVLSNGWTESVCRTGSLYTGNVSGLVVLLFVFSKVVDLVETVLVLLEGRRPLAIHVIHHAVTLIYTWHGYSHQHSVARWFVFVNLLSHVLLYSYLSPQKFGIRPCWLMVCAAQIVQLVVCLLVSMTAQNVLLDGGRCDVDEDRLWIDKLVAGAFIVIFADFYHGKWRQFRASRMRPNEKREEGGRESSVSLRSSRSGKSSVTMSVAKSRNGWSKTGITPTLGGYHSN